MRTITMTVYTIDEHPNPESCFDWIRANWHDLNESSANKLMASIKALSERIGGTFDYSISQVPSRGEHITFKDYDADELALLAKLIKGDDPCPLTGICWDADVIEGLSNGSMRPVLETLHDETEYIYSDEGLNELCKGNEYEFYEDGSYF